ncbi:MAG: EAL domain-containing protein [bacterium]|nr:EAL domain-containing protein [bacterium]
MPGPPRRSLHRLEVLRTVAEHLNREVELEPMLSSVLALIPKLTSLKTGWITLLDDEGGFVSAAAHGLPPALAANDWAALRWTPCRCQQMLRSGELSTAANIVDCERLQRVHQALADADPATVAEQTGGLHVHISVPLRAGDRVLGIMNLARAGKELVDQETLTLLGLVADTFGVAIERARLHTRVEAARREEAQVASRLAETLLGLTALEEVGAAAFAVLRESLKPDSLSLLVADPSGSFLELVAGWGWSKAYVGRLQLALHPPESSGPAWALHVRRPVVEDHTKPSAPFAVPEPVRQAGVQVCLNLPMVAGDRPTGVIVADYLTAQEVSEGQIRFATLIAGVATVALERALEHRRNRLLFEQLPVGLYRSTPAGQLLEVNEALARLLGYSDRAALLATNAVQIYANPEDRVRWQQLMDREGVVADFEVQWRRFDGTVIWVGEAARVVRDATGRPAYYEGSVEDITARKRFEADVLYLASHDALTGVFNRHRFQEELHRQITQAQRSGQTGALLFVDLDNFKEVNDRLGYRAGDDLLGTVARAIRGRLRESEVFARIGGDEFGIVLVSGDAYEARGVAERVLAAVREQVALVAGRPIRLTLSCGIALFPEHGVTVDEVLAAADVSLHAAKDLGGDRAVVYVPDPAWRDQLRVPPGWAERLKEALAQDRLIAYAQPILDLRRDQVSQWELLVRLLEGSQVVEPAAFLPIAERMGLIQQIDLCICGQALQLISRRNLRVHVNLSAKTLGDDGAIRAIVAALDASGVPPANLVLEITETAAVADVAQTLRCVETLRARGCQLALDDFGVGFSSLYYLRHLPVDYLKIDGSFIRTLVTDPQNQQIVRAIAELARGLGRATIAEWVEDEATLQKVRALGVDYAQGYHVGRPMPLSEL